jgi:hypothetical protein
MTYWSVSGKPGAMTGDGVAGDSDLLLSAVHGQKLKRCGSGTAASRVCAWRLQLAHFHQPSFFLTYPFVRCPL